MFVSPAYAQIGGAGDSFGMFVPLILIFVVFYFLMIRPQQKKQKSHREMIGALRRGDRIVTNGGLIGSISRVANDSELIVEVASGVKVRVLRSMVAEILSKPQPVRRRAKQEAEDEVEEGDYEEGELDEEFEDEEGEEVEEGEDVAGGKKVKKGEEGEEGEEDEEDDDRADKEQDGEDEEEERPRTRRARGSARRR